MALLWGSSGASPGSPLSIWPSGLLFLYVSSMSRSLTMIIERRKREEGEGHSQPAEPRGVRTPPQIRRLGIPANALIGTS